MELKFQQLNLEYTKKSADINRRKEEVVRRKRGFLQSASDGFLAIKRKTMSKTGDLRKMMVELEEGDPKKDALRQQIRQLENELSVAKSESQSVVSRIHSEAYEARMMLDNESRELTIWLESEKLKLYEQQAQDPEGIACDKED